MIALPAVFPFSSHARQSILPLLPGRAGRKKEKNAPDFKKMHFPC